MKWLNCLFPHKAISSAKNNKEKAPTQISAVKVLPVPSKSSVSHSRQSSTLTLADPQALQWMAHPSHWERRNALVASLSPFAEVQVVSQNVADVGLNGDDLTGYATEVDTESGSFSSRRSSIISDTSSSCMSSQGQAQDEKNLSTPPSPTSWRRIVHTEFFAKSPFVPNDDYCSDSEPELKYELIQGRKNNGGV